MCFRGGTSASVRRLGVGQRRGGVRGGRQRRQVAESREEAESERRQRASVPASIVLDLGKGYRPGAFCYAGASLCLAAFALVHVPWPHGAARSAVRLGRSGGVRSARRGGSEGEVGVGREERRARRAKRRAVDHVLRVLRTRAAVRDSKPSSRSLSTRAVASVGSPKKMKPAATKSCPLPC